MHKLPVRAFKCVVELTINEVSAPGVRLASKDDLYLNVCLLGQQRRTRLVQPLFPLKFGDHLFFEKTFKFCREPNDVVQFLNDLHVLIELIQLGRSENNEVLAWYETNAKGFLYPINSSDPHFTSGQQDAFMTRSDEFPGSISPQLIFSTSTHIEETQTPSLDILREYENRFINDPLIEMNKTKLSKKKTKSPKKGILRNQENFANHTISSAIKSDYTHPDVRFKLAELNQSVKKMRIIKTAPSIKLAQKNSGRPFVVRKVEDRLILRKPELHDVLHDGLVVTRKNRNLIKRRRGSVSSLKINKFNHSSRSRSNDLKFTSPSLDNIHIRSKSLDNTSRSLSPNSRSLNTNLKFENDRSTSRSVSSSRRQNQTYDILPEFEDQNNANINNHSAKLDTNLENCNICSNTHPSNCEVCQDFKYRTQQNFRGHRFHRDETGLSKTSNSSAVFNKINNNKDHLNETQLLDSEKMTFLDHYGSSNSFRESHEHSKNIHKTKKKSNNYPINQSFSNYAPPACKQDWRYQRYYPWLFNYTEYLRELEDELHWLKVRSKYLNKS